MNLPDTEFTDDDIFTPKDMADITYGAEIDFDYVAISFIQHAENLRTLRKIMAEKGYKKNVKIIAKIETKQSTKSVEIIDEIVKATDVVMVARGDMGYEVGMQYVPSIQRKLIASCRRYGKAVIVATQTMASMEHSPVPTRAEADNIAAAVISGADAIMLSEE